MLWQDIVISIAQIVFSVALIPQIYNGFVTKKGVIKISTSIPTFITLIIMSFAFLTLGLYFSALISFLTGLMWFILFLQKLIY